MMTSPETVRLSLDEAIALCTQAALARGASLQTASSLARSVVAAEAEGQSIVGLSHFFDYLEALAAGRIDGQAEPAITRPAATMIASDANGGAAHPGFDLAFDMMVETAKTLGMVMFTQRNSFTCGSLGYFTGRLAQAGLAAFAATNGPPLMAASTGSRPVYSTNPFAFSAPSADGNHLTIDQASSATAFINIRKAAMEGRSIPEGWAVDAAGKSTTDATAALTGALLAFGGARGANIALMVEVMAAGLTGANWSLDAPSFTKGDRTPGTGMLIIALRPDLVAPDFDKRLATHLERLAQEHGVYIPGRSRLEFRQRAEQQGLDVPAAFHGRLSAFCKADETLP